MPLIKSQAARVPVGALDSREWVDGTKEAALQAARRIDPGVEEAQIVPTRLDLVFLYTANRQDDPRVETTGTRGWFSER